MAGYEWPNYIETHDLKEGEYRQKLEQAQARVKLLYGVATAVKTGLAHSHRELGAECGEVPCTLCWLHGTAEEALAALAEGDNDDRSGKYPAWDQNEAP